MFELPIKPKQKKPLKIRVWVCVKIPNINNNKNLKRCVSGLTGNIAKYYNSAIGWLS